MCCEPPILSEAVSLEQPVVRCRWPAKQRLSDADGTAPEQYTAVDVTAALARPRTASELDACVSSHDDENSADNRRAPLPKRARVSAPAFPGAGRLLDCTAAVKRNAAAIVECSNPLIVTLPAFVTVGESKQLMDAGKSCMERSPMLGTGPRGELSQHGEFRTSSSAFPPGCEWLMQRVADLTGFPVDHMEQPQIVHYAVGQFFAGHYDAVDMNSDVGRSFAASGGQRLVTVLIYLNTVQFGGATRFNLVAEGAGVSVQPVQGSAVVFFPAVPATPERGAAPR